MALKEIGVGWMLTITTATPGLYTIPDAVISSNWTSEKDCKQAEKLEIELNELKGNKVATRCDEVIYIDIDDPYKGRKVEKVSNP